MANEIQKAEKKIADLKEQHAKWEGIFQKSETKRANTVKKLQSMIDRCNKKAGEIAAKKAKVLEDYAAGIVVAESELTSIKNAIQYASDHPTPAAAPAQADTTAAPAPAPVTEEVQP